jgi:predicted nucleic acid-binding Zn ribbon protein
MRALSHVSHAVPGALAELLSAAPISTGKVSFAWRVAVGPALERVTSVRLEGRVLIIEAASAQWAREVTRSSDVILARLQTLLGRNSLDTISVRTVKC